VSLSGVVLNRAPGTLTGPADALAGVVPIVPTADRDFSRADRVEAFVRVCQGGAKPPVAQSLVITIRNEQGGTDERERRTIEPGAFTTIEGVGADRSPLYTADVSYLLPLTGLAAGAHLLTFDATSGATVLTRAVRFVVR